MVLEEFSARPEQGRDTILLYCCSTGDLIPWPEVCYFGLEKDDR